MPLALRTPCRDRRVRNERAVDGNIVGARSTHAKNAPRIQYFDAWRAKRERKMQHRRAVFGIVPDSTGHEHAADRDATGEDLATGDSPAAVDAFCPARSCDPVRPTAADEHEILCDDISQ